MPKRIILVRHGETDFNREKILQGQLDTYLNDNGFNQAKKAAQILTKEEIEVIYSSDLKRTFQTAQIIAGFLKMEIITTPLLRERTYGDFEGLTKVEIEKYYKHLPFSWESGFLDSVSRHFKVESDKDLAKRVGKFFKMLKNKHKDKNVLLVIHGGVIWSIFSILNLAVKIGKNGKSIFANASVCILEKKGEGYRLKT